MKKFMLKQIMMLAAGMLAVSCISKVTPDGGKSGDGNGKLQLSEVGVSEDLRESSITTRAGEVDTDNFNVCIVKSTDQSEVCSYDYCDFPSPYTIAVGDYVLNIQSHEVQDAEWEKVYYALSEPFSISEGQTTTLSGLECKVSNILVSVRFSERMKRVMGDDCNVAVKVGNCGPLDYDVEEMQRGCFRAENENNSLVWEFSGTLDGEYYDVTDFILNAKAGEHRTLNFDIEPTPDPEKGNAEFVFTVSAECTTYDVNLNVEIEKEHVIEPFDPGIEIVSDYSLVAVNTLNKSETLDGDGQPVVDLGMNVTSDNGIASVTVLLTTDNATLQGALAASGITGAFELATVEDPLKSLLAGFGFPTGDAVAGKAELDLGLSGMLPMLFGLGEDINQFDVKVTVCDVKGGSVSSTLRMKLVDDTKVPAITIEGVGFDVDERMPIPQAEAETTAIVVDINVPEGISSFVVDITSTSPHFNAAVEDIQFAGGFDIANPESQELADGLETLGLPHGNQVKGQTSMRFDITSFVPLLFIYVPNGDYDADFKLTVTDSKGNVITKTIMVALTAE